MRRSRTIIVDHERRKTLALLPNRDGNALREWLERHPGVEVITRDRSNAYAEACTWGAPQAEQVLDRWHLLKNLFEAVKEKVKLGWSKRSIARELNLSRATIHKYLALEELPEHGNRRARGSQLDPFKGFLEERYREGCHNAAQLYREARLRGYAGGRTIVKEFVQRLRGSATTAGTVRSVPARLPSPRSLAWWLLLPEKLPADRREWLTAILAELPDLARLTELARWGWRALRDRQREPFGAWLRAAQERGSPELRRYAQGLQLESRATANALAFSWSNGPTEGQVNRLKTIKRGRYGRAGFDLLAAKVLYQG